MKQKQLVNNNHSSLLINQLQTSELPLLENNSDDFSVSNYNSEQA